MVNSVTFNGLVEGSCRDVVQGSTKHSPGGTGTNHDQTQSD